MGDNWRQIANFPYQVSDTGLVRRMHKDGTPGIVNALFDDGNGYPAVKLYCGGKAKGVRVHRLVAEAWIPNPDGKRTINHIDGDRSNNYVTNLEWATHSENIRHSYDVLGRESTQAKMSRRIEELEHELAVIKSTAGRTICSRCYQSMIGNAAGSVDESIKEDT